MRADIKRDEVLVDAKEGRSECAVDHWDARPDAERERVMKGVAKGPDSVVVVGVNGRRNGVWWDRVP